MNDIPDSDADGDLDALVRRVDPDRWLSSRFIADAHARADVVAIYAFDHELARAPKVASNALLGEIRLTWWAEVLGEIFEGRPVRRHPTAQALAHAVHHWSLPRPPLEAMVEARFRELDPAPMTDAESLAWAMGSAGSAAVLAAAALDPAGEAELAAKAGALWALAVRGRPTAALRAEARKDARRLSVAAFPAVAHGALASAHRGGRTPSEVEKRWRLTWAVATGRI